MTHAFLITDHTIRYVCVQRVGVARAARSLFRTDNQLFSVGQLTPTISSQPIGTLPRCLYGFPMQHIPSERLAAIAKNEDQLFTYEDLEHIKACADCFHKWKAFFIEKLDAEKRWIIPHGKWLATGIRPIHSKEERLVDARTALERHSAEHACKKGGAPPERNSGGACPTSRSV